MATYKIKQKFWSLGGKFEIMDSYGNLAYEVTGSYFKIPKYFKISSPDGQPVAKITKVMWQFLPKFDVALNNGTKFRIQKSFTLFKSRYQIADLGLDIRGNFWDMNFELIHEGRVVADISQEWLKINSTYNVAVYDDNYSDIVISLVVAIDYVKAEQASSASASAGSSAN